MKTIRQIFEQRFIPILEKWGLVVRVKRCAATGCTFYLVQNDFPFCDWEAWPPSTPVELAKRSIFVIERWGKDVLIGNHLMYGDAAFPAKQRYSWYEAEDISAALAGCVSVFITHLLYDYLDHRGFNCLWLDEKGSTLRVGELPLFLSFRINEDLSAWAFIFEDNSGGTLWKLKRKVSRPPMKYFRQVARALSVSLI
jgi:hypothetical protein